MKQPAPNEFIPKRSAAMIRSGWFARTRVGKNCLLDTEVRMSSVRIGVVWLIIFGLTLPAAVVLSTQLARRSFEKVQLRTQTISVKGYAEHDITSDRANWTATIVQRDPQLAAAYSKLEDSRNALLKYLDGKGFPSDKVEIAPAGVEIVYKRDEKGNRTNAIEYYALSQALEISSAEVQKVAKAARESSALIKDGIELTSQPPQYIYTQLNQLKLQMLGDASDNAHERAKLLVEHGGGKLGPMRAGSQGVFQITPAFSTEVSGSGENDTTSIQKVIKAVVTQEYAIE